MVDINENDREVILTESAVKQLVKNIKDADKDIKDNYIPKSTFNKSYQIMYSTPADTPANTPASAVLDANTTSTKKFLSMKGTGGENNATGAAPAWSSIESSDLPLATTDAIGGVKIGANINLEIENNKNTGKIFVPVATEYTTSTDDNGQTVKNQGTLGVVSIGDNIDIINGEISVPQANNQGTLGVVSIGDNININNNGEISVPAATAGENGVNGVVTTGEQAFGGIKKFVSGSGISSNEQNGKLSFYRDNQESCFINSYRFAPGEQYLRGQVSFGIYSYDNNGNRLNTIESYNLPITEKELQNNIAYNILTTKTSKNVSVAPPTSGKPGIKLSFSDETTKKVTGITGVTASNTVIVSPVASDGTTTTMSSWEVWREAGIRCIKQENGSLTFKADDKITSTTYFNVIILD